MGQRPLDEFVELVTYDRRASTSSACWRLRALSLALREPFELSLAVNPHFQATASTTEQETRHYVFGARRESFDSVAHPVTSAFSTEGGYRGDQLLSPPVVNLRPMKLQFWFWLARYRAEVTAEGTRVFARGRREVRAHLCADDGLWAACHRSPGHAHSRQDLGPGHASDAVLLGAVAVQVGQSSGGRATGAGALRHPERNWACTPTGGRSPSTQIGGCVAHSAGDSSKGVDLAGGARADRASISARKSARQTGPAMVRVQRRRGFVVWSAALASWRAGRARNSPRWNKANVLESSPPVAPGHRRTGA